MTHQIETFIAWGQGELIRIFASIFLLAAALQFETWSCSKVSQVGQENWKCSCYSLSRIHGRRQKRHDRMATQREKHPFLSAFIQELPSALPLPPPPSLLLLLVFCFLFVFFFFFFFFFGSPWSTRDKAQLRTNWSESLNHIPRAVRFIQQMALPENRIVRTCMDAASSPRGKGSCTWIWK